MWPFVSTSPRSPIPGCRTQVSGDDPLLREITALEAEGSHHRLALEAAAGLRYGDGSGDGLWAGGRKRHPRRGGGGKPCHDKIPSGHLCSSFLVWTHGHTWRTRCGNPLPQDYILQKAVEQYTQMAPLRTFYVTKYVNVGFRDGRIAAERRLPSHQKRLPFKVKARTSKSHPL